MDLSSYREHLVSFMKMTEDMDSAGGGMILLTKGRCKTGEGFLNELGLFLLNIINDLPFVNRNHLELLDMVLHQGFVHATPEQIKSLAVSVDEHDPEENASVNAYVVNDVLMSVTKKERITICTTGFINLYKLMGQGLVIASGQYNQKAMDRIERYTSVLERRIEEIRPQYDEMLAKNSTTDIEDIQKSTTESDRSADIDISNYVPDGVTLTEVQQEYVKAIVELMSKQETVRMIDVANHLGKSRGSVSSAMKILSEKGVLETDSKGVITLLTKAKSLSNTLVLDQNIILELPDGYTYEVKELNGEKTAWIQYGKSMDHQKDAYEFKGSVNLIDCRPNEETNEVRGVDEKPLEVVCRRAAGFEKHIDIDAKCMAFTTKQPINLLGRLMKFKMVSIMAEVDNDTVVSIQVIYQQDDMNMEQDRKNVSHIIKLFRCMKIKGQQCSTGNLNEDDLIKLAHWEFAEYGEEPASDVHVATEIRVNGETVDEGSINLGTQPEPEEKIKAEPESTQVLSAADELDIHDENNEPNYSARWNYGYQEDPMPVEKPVMSEETRRKRNMLRKRIHDLEKEKEAAKGLFGGMKRNKIQKQIDELNKQLQELEIS